jgi:FkbM family methyltransferase
MLPPPPASFVASVPAGGFVVLRHREVLGLAHFIHGGFEAAELRLICSRIPSGSTVFDVGANVGYVTIPLALAVGPSGRVWAFEPDAENVKRLSDNVALNRLNNVEIRQIAIGADDGKTDLYLSDDPVFHTIAIHDERMPITDAYEMRKSVKVTLARLDTVWNQAGSPDVDFVKIDVEGAELYVLEGGKHLIESCRPTLLIETTDARLDTVKAFLGPFNYAHSHPPGFSPGNQFFTPR